MNKLSNINNTVDSYQRLISFYEENKLKVFDQVNIELHKWFAANMSAVLGAILDRLSANFNNINFHYISPDIESILLKNDFLTYYGKTRKWDNNQTTIKYQKLKPADGKYFKTYVIEELIENHHTDLPKMSNGAKEKIVEAIYEIFVNAQIHSNTEFIYTCGQFYPIKNKIEFTVVDTGIGFKENIYRRFKRKVSSVQAIKWAVQDRATTKLGVSGGIGLAILREFINLNLGKMQIISGNGFYQFDYTGERAIELRGNFPGTIVNLQFKTDDKKNYSLKSEININDIF